MRTLLVALAALAVGIFFGHWLGREDRAPNRAATHRLDPAAPSTDRGGVYGRQSPSANGRITGSVTTGDGKPLAGFVVYAQERFDRSVGGKAPPLPKAALKTRTDPAGAFAFHGLRDAVHSVGAFSRGYELQTSATRVRPGAHVEFVAVPLLETTVTILDPDGDPVPGATLVVLRDGDRRDASTRNWTKDDPAVFLPEGEHSIWARRSGHRSDAISVRVPTRKTLELRLVRVVGIRVRLELGGAALISDCHARAVRYDDEEPSDRTLANSRIAAFARPDGTFRFDAIEPGRYLVGLADSSWRILGKTSVDANDGVTEAVIRISPPPADCVVVHAFAPDGSRIHKPVVHTGFEGPKGGGSNGGTVIRRSDGSFWVLHHPSEGAEGTHSIKIETEYGERAKTYRRGELKEWTVRFGDPATVLVSLSGYRLKDHEGILQVALVRRDASESIEALMAREHQEPDPKGRVEFGPVAAGPCELRFYAVEVDRLIGLPAGRHEVLVRAGENRIQVPVPALFSVSVASAGWQKGQSLQLELPTTEDWTPTIVAVAGEDGRVVFRNVPAGEYRISGTSSGKAGWMRIHVPETTHVVWRPTSGG